MLQSKSTSKYDTNLYHFREQEMTVELFTKSITLSRKSFWSTKRDTFITEATFGDEKKHDLFIVPCTSGMYFLRGENGKFGVHEPKAVSNFQH